MKDETLGRVMLWVATPVVIGALALQGCSDADPNIECNGHGGVVKVYQSGNNVNGGVCKDGHYFDGGDI